MRRLYPFWKPILSTTTVALLLSGSAVRAQQPASTQPLPAPPPWKYIDAPTISAYQPMGPIIPMPNADGVVPPPPDKKPTPPNPKDPATPAPAPAPAPVEFGNLSEGPGQGSQEALATPNVFGDTLGGTGLLRIVLSGQTIVIPGKPGTPGTPAIPGTPQTLQGTATFAPPSATGFTVTGVTLNQLTNPGPLTYTQAGGSKSFMIPGTSTFTASNGPLTGVGPSVANLSGASANVNSAVQALYPKLITQFQSGSASVPYSTFELPYTNLTATYNLYNPATAGTPATPGTPGTPATTIHTPPILFEVPSPSAGGLVGYTKISEGNNPLPRDRIIFDYDFYDDAQVTANGTSVHRFSPGFEKTFFDQRTSIEVRVPFASTIDNDLTDTGINSTGHIEFGDVNITLKALLYKSETFNFAAGLGIALPTASGVYVSMVNGTPLIDIHNDAVILTPYFAYLLTPNNRVFFQNWFQYGIDANGNQVDANTSLTGLQYVGRLNDQALLQIDAQLGYWVYRSENESSLLQGLAPFIELHYDTTVGKADCVSAGAFAVGDPNSHFDELNLSAGFAAQVGSNLLLSFGAVVPLGSQQDRSFDWQVGLRASYYFGATRLNNASSRVSNF